MKENKKYSISTFSISTFLLFSVAIIVLFTVFSVLFFSRINFSTDWLGVIVFILAAGFFIGWYGIFSIYLLWTYYQKEKDVKICIDYTKGELQYVELRKETRKIKLEDIVAIEVHGSRGMPGYDKIILNNGTFLVITNLFLVSIVRSIRKNRPDIKFKVKDTGGLRLPSTTSVAAKQNNENIQKLNFKETIKQKTDKELEIISKDHVFYSEDERLLALKELELRNHPAGECV